MQIIKLHVVKDDQVFTLTMSRLENMQHGYKVAHVSDESLNDYIGKFYDHTSFDTVDELLLSTTYPMDEPSDIIYTNYKLQAVTDYSAKIEKSKLVKFILINSEGNRQFVRAVMDDGKCTITRRTGRLDNNYLSREIDLSKLEFGEDLPVVGPVSHYGYKLHSISIHKEPDNLSESELYCIEKCSAPINKIMADQVADEKFDAAFISQVKTQLSVLLADQVIFEDLQFCNIKQFSTGGYSLYIIFRIIRKNYLHPDAVTYDVGQRTYQITCHNRAAEIKDHILS